MKYVLLVVLAIVVAPTADAQPESAYYGLALGSFDFQQDDPLGNEVFADTTDSYRLMVGYQFGEHLAVEGAWGKTSTIVDSTLIFGPPPVDFRSEIQGLTIRLLGVLNFDSGVTLLGGIGYADMTQDVDLVDQGVTVVSNEQDVGEVTYYAGAQYDWERFAIRLGYEKYDVSGGIDIEETSVVFFYKL